MQEVPPEALLAVEQEAQGLLRPASPGSPLACSVALTTDPAWFPASLSSGLRDFRRSTTRVGPRIFLTTPWPRFDSGIRRDGLDLGNAVPDQASCTF